MESRKGFRAADRRWVLYAPKVARLTGDLSPLVPLLQLDAQAIRDPIYKREVRRDQGQIQNGPVAPTGFSEKLNILFPARRRLARELLGEFEQGKLRLGDRRVAVVVGDGFDE